MDAIDTDGITKLLVEIAIVNLSVPTHVDRVEAHEFLHGIRIEIPHQQVHILGKFSTAMQKVGKPLDGHVGDCEELIKENTKVLGQLLLVLNLKLFLWGRQKGSQRVVDQIELETGGIAALLFIVTVSSIPRIIQCQEGGDGSLKDATSSLGVDVFCRIAGETRNDVDVVLLQKFDQILLSWLLQNREVATVNDDQILATNCPGRADQVTKVVIELGGSPSYVQRVDAGSVFEKL
mmetsp:Transcript_11546/g.29229  ORF Transcript_11546/g.29229 Transcript_11546/m.29229 type:complete len:235 (-) Transcript_11546:946-1650(-)